MSQRKPPPGTQSVLRAIALLKAFTGDEPEMTLSELTDTVGLTRTTTHRLLSALESEGLVARNPVNNAYRLGPAAIALGSRALRTNDLRAVARPHLEELVEETGETATLEVLADGRMLIIDEVLSQHLVGTGPSIGTSYPLHATSTGKALLAAMPDRQWKKLVGDRLEPVTEHTISDPERLAEEIEEVRERGFATAVEELERGFAAASAVIRGPLGDPVASISVGGPSVRLGEDELPRLGRLCLDAAERISRRLGYEP